MLTVLIGLGSALSYALHDFLMVKVVRTATIWAGLIWSMSLGLLILLPLALVLHGLPSGSAEWQATAYAVAGGICEVVALSCLLRGLVSGNLSIVLPLASLGGGMAALVAVVGGESLSRTAMIGLPLAILGGLLASLEKAPAAEAFELAEGTPGGESAAVLAVRQTRATAGAGWALLSTVFFASFVLLVAQASALPPVAVAAYGRAGTLLVLTPVILVVFGLRLPRALIPRCACAGTLDAVGFITFVSAVTLGPLAIASMVVSQAGTFAALLGYVLLRERLSRPQYAGVACTCVACTLFALS